MPGIVRLTIVLLTASSAGCKQEAGSQRQATTVPAVPTTQAFAGELLDFIASEERGSKRYEAEGVFDDRQRYLRENLGGLRERAGRPGFWDAPREPWVRIAELLHDDETPGWDRLGLGVYFFGSYPRELVIRRVGPSGSADIARVPLVRSRPNLERFYSRKVGYNPVYVTISPSRFPVATQPTVVGNPAHEASDVSLEWNPWTHPIRCAVIDDDGRESNEVPLMILPAAGVPYVTSGSGRPTTFSAPK